ncbi:MAG TPA: ABC transporter permease [Ardenticatenaceae bacterium]|nr:ABC transporter permease [Ardenticatenaceae bacterium]
MSLDLADLFTIELARSGIRLATPILLAAIGGAICNRAGVLNFALEGMMLGGAFLGIVAAFWLGSSELGVVAALLAGAFIGLIFAFLYLRYKVDLVILALALNLLIAELTVFLLRILFNAFGSWSDPSIKQLPDLTIPVVAQIPVLGPLLSGHNVVVYLSWLAAIGAYVVLFHTKFGRHVRAVGENQAAAEAVGINVPSVKLFALVISGALAAVGGAFLSVGHLTLFTREMSAGRGWLAVTAALFGLNHPIFVFFTSLFFGLADATAVRLQTTTDIPPSLVQFLPNLAALLALILIGLRGRLGERFARRRFRARARQQVAPSAPPVSGD